VNLSAASGDMGILANHVPSIEPLRPGVVEVIESGNASKKWFSEYICSCNKDVHRRKGCSLRWICNRSSQQQTHHQRRGGGTIGGFFTRGRFLSGSATGSNSQLSLQAIRANLQEALKVAAGNGLEEDKTEARIEADVYEALQHAVGSK